MVVADQSVHMASIVWVLSGPHVSYSTTGRLLLAYTVLPGHFSTNGSKPSISLNYCRVTLFPSRHSYEVILNLVYDIAVPYKCQLLWSLPSSVDLCPSTLLLPCVSLLHLFSIAKNEVFGKGLWSADGITCWCVAVPAYNVSQVTVFNHMTHNAINFVFSRRISRLLCSTASFFQVYWVAWFLGRIVWSWYVLSLCDFCWRRQCLQVEWNGNS